MIKRDAKRIACGIAAALLLGDTYEFLYEEYKPKDAAKIENCIKEIIWELQHRSETPQEQEELIGAFYDE